MKRIWKSVLISGLLLFTAISVVAAAATTPSLKVTSEAAILIEPVSGEILFTKNAEQKMHPASVTKLMVILLTLEAVERGDLQLNELIAASPEACKMGGSQIWLEPGEEMSVEELLKAVCIVSANDASYAIGEHLAGSEDNFIVKMNERAKELGLSNTTYVNATGLEPPDGSVGNMTSAADMGKLACEVLKYPYILKWTGTWIDYLRDGQSFLRNTNKLVRFYQGCDGLKTGFTVPAGFCLVGTAKRNGVRLVAVVMKAENDKKRAQDMSALFNYGFTQYKAHCLYNGGEKIGEIKVIQGKEKKVEYKVASELSAIVKREARGTIDKQIKIAEFLRAPVKSGQKIGEVILLKDGNPCGKSDLIAVKKVERNSFLGIFREVFQTLLRVVVGI